MQIFSRTPAWCLLTVGLLCLWANTLFAAETVKVAVASNFISTAREIAAAFKAQTGINVQYSAASTGKLYAQIRHGLPVDLFMSADQLRPELLVEEGLADGASRFTYAIGELVLWVPKQTLSTEQCAVWLQSSAMGRLAIANPRTAPYGAAAVEVLQQLGVYDALSKRLVQGENIGQAFLYVDSLAADAGLVARSQLLAKRKQLKRELDGCQWLPQADLYQGLRQDVVVLNESLSKEHVVLFVDWLQSPSARQLIKDNGYRLP